MSLPIEKFLAKKPELLKKILARALAPLEDVVALNATLELYRQLQLKELPVEIGNGGKTKWKCMH